jgi:bifunctional DNA-binding transcriptional regulator/antitoxin component of YhaV-PrlF toxin-antitoxin module
MTPTLDKHPSVYYPDLGISYMSKLIAVSPVGKNGQAVVPAKIRRLFQLSAEGGLVGFYLNFDRVELAPVSVVREKPAYTESELDRLDALAREKGARRFKSSRAAKARLKSL